MKHLMLLVIAAVFLTACDTEIDNYTGPDARLYGHVMDVTTNEGVQLRGGGTTGAHVRYVPLNSEYPGATYASLAIKNDGSFKDTRMMSGQYRFYLQRFPGIIAPDEQEEFIVDLHKGDNEPVDFKVIPNLHINVEYVDGEIQIYVDKPEEIPQVAKITNLQIMYGTTYILNSNVANEAAGTLYKDKLYYGLLENLEIPARFSMSEIFPEAEDGTYYLRVSCELVGGAGNENYSKPIQFEYKKNEDEVQ